ncbi:MAG: hypothetical protein J6P21_00980 [Clostridia bacterium]|nr:hypothetical protein [Clostridia bacterium]
MRKILDKFLCKSLKFNNFNFINNRKFLAVSLSVFYLASSVIPPARTYGMENYNKSNSEKFKDFIVKNKVFISTSLVILAIGLTTGLLILSNKNKIDEGFPDDGLPDENISEIKQDLLRKASKLKSGSNNFATKWDILCFLLGKNATKFVKENYPEWEERTKNISYGNKNRMDFALMSIAFSLRLAALEKYNYLDRKNNELLVGRNLPDVNLMACKNNKNLFKIRMNKIIVEDDDILRSAHKFILNHPGFNSRIGFLNACSPHSPNGYLDHGCNALEECFSSMTDLVKALSGKEFRIGKGTQGFYNNEKDFPGICSSNESPNIDNIRQRLTGPGRDFYHERGIMSRNVRLIRNLGDCIKNNYNSDSSFSWSCPGKTFAEFNPPSDGLGNTRFRILNIAGLEERSRSILDTFGNYPIDPKKPNGDTIYQTWEKITKKQCEFVLKAFINEKVKVLFLCAFGAGAFGGKASMVAKCFKELLIDKGYIDYFDYVVFPIGYDKNNFEAFKSEFQK